MIITHSLFKEGIAISYKKAQTIFLLLSFVFLTTMTANSQETKIWTLEECINYALENNLNVKKQVLSIDLQNELLKQSQLEILPNLNGFVSHGYNWGQRIDPFTNRFATDRVRSNNLFLSADLNLFSGLQQLNKIKKNKLQLMASQYDSDAYKDEISINVATAYLQMLFFMESVGIAENQLGITVLQVNRTKKLVEAGTLAKGDLLTIEAQQASEELTLINAENNLELARLTLSQLLELATPEGFEIEEPELGLIESPETFLTPEKIYTTALDLRPEIKSASVKVESSERDLDIARGTLYPRLSLSGSWGSGYSGANKIGKDPFTQSIPFGYTASNETVYFDQTGYQSFSAKPFSEQLNDNMNESIGLNLNIPIFNGWKSRSSIAQAKIGIANANLDLELKKNNLYKTIQQAYNDASSALNKHKASKKKVEATSESFKYSEQKFNVGLINSVDYNNAKKENNNALAELVQSKYDFVFRMIVIDFYLGKPLTLTR
ncbi:MAG: TolC family protein [Chlorobi bacterium]|nr:TolC family protein [Chlorobiota bacterium]